MRSDTYAGTEGSLGTDQSTEEVRQKAQETASTIASQAQEVAAAQANSQMTRAASLLDGVAQSLHQTGEGIREDQPQIASLADQAATRVEGISGYLRDHDFNDVVRDAENYARREPLIFLGGAFALGFIAARFLKASAPQSRMSGYGVSGERGYRGYRIESGTGYGTTDYGSTGYGRGYGSEYGSGAGVGTAGGTATVGSGWSGGSAATPTES